MAEKIRGTNGGRRSGAGRKKGYRLPATLDQIADRLVRGRRDDRLSTVQDALTTTYATSCTDMSAWDVNLTGTNQQDLVITDDEEPAVTVDDLEIAQFMYIL